MSKVEIVIDADVLIHFSRVSCLSLLPEIFPEYTYVILSVVYDEVKPPIRVQLDNTVSLLGKMKVRDFEPKGDMKCEYAMLRKKYGKGESACMAYCKYTNNVIGSSNLKDIKNYCEQNGVTYLTTIDFLYYAIRRELMSIAEAQQFLSDVISQGSKLPLIDFSTYVSPVQM
jgi:predicted nucleic acid-binding protein